MFLSILSDTVFVPQYLKTAQAVLVYCGTQYMKPVLPPPPHPHPLKISNWIFSIKLNFYHYIVLKKS